MTLPASILVVLLASGPQAESSRPRSYANIVVPASSGDFSLVDPASGRRHPYKGSDCRVSPIADLDSGLLEHVDALNRALVKQDPCLPDRLAYFSWCQARGLAIVGWNGHVDQAAPVARGILARVRVRPKIVSPDHVAASCGDFRFEYWILSMGDEPLFVGSSFAKVSYHVSFFGL